jgi:SAM-dependent methyltransferase
MFLLNRLTRDYKNRLKEEKANGSHSHRSKLLARTQSQLDTLIYSLSDSLEKLEKANGSTAPSQMAATLKNDLDKAKRVRPPRIIPPSLLNEYTLGGRVPVGQKYRESDYTPDKPLVYTREAVDTHIDNIKNKRNIFPRYGQTNIWLFEALTANPIQNKDVAVMGSNKPWFESVCLAYGGRCTTIEYNKIVSEHPGIKTMTPSEYDRSPVRFDASFSISSFEHNGLGRYGDPLNPNGDLDAMKKMKSILKPGGLLFLAVPVGRDMVLWNANRVYGRLRLPLLLQGWELVKSYGFEEKLLDQEKNRYEPVFVLKNI